MRFCGRDRLEAEFRGRTVCIVGSGPGSLENDPGEVDSHDVVVRVNNYGIRPGSGTGARTDVFYSFHGNSIQKTRAELIADGVKLVICKCPDAKFMDSEWHRRNGKMNGVDFRYIYQARKDFWFCDTYVPTVAEFMASFDLLGRHVPTTGFAAILEILACQPARLMLTGFDFFTSRVHNLNQPWRPANRADPIGHVPEVEMEWLRANRERFPITMDKRLRRMVG